MQFPVIFFQIHFPMRLRIMHHHQQHKFLLISSLIALFSIALGLETIRQCTCNQQHKCFESMKDEVAECLDQCVDRAGLEKMVYGKSKLASCLEMRKKIIFNFFDCVASHLGMVESCYALGIAEQRVPYRDFEGIFLKHIQPLVDKDHRDLEEFHSGMEIPFFIKSALSIDKCSRQCGLKKLHNLYCFNGQKCGLKVTDELVKGTIGKCWHQMDVKRRFSEFCQCFDQDGANDVSPFCQHLLPSHILEEEMEHF